LRSELIKPILLGLEKALAGGNMTTVGAAVLAEPKVSRFVVELALDLKQNRGKSAVVIGTNQPADVHAIAARINGSLGNAGSTVFYAPTTEAQDRTRHVDDAKALVADMKGGKVAGLLILGGNPAYNMPADLDFASALAKVKVSMHLSMYDNETSKLSNWHLNRTHYLESWGDSRSYDGTQTVMQPLLEPLYDGMSMTFVLKLLAGLEETNDETLVRNALVPSNITGVLGDKAWRRLVHDGYVPGSASQEGPSQVKNLPSMTLTASQKQGSRLPNGALVSPATAKDLGISNGDMLKISVGERSLEIVAHVTPGQAPYSVGLPLGWGRTRAGYVGGHEDLKIKAPGFDTYQLRTTSGFHQATGATVKTTGATYALAETQDHFAMDDIGTKAVQKRANIQIKTGTAKEYKEQGSDLVTKDAHLPIEKILTRPIEGREINASLYDEHEYKGHKWGMTIDLGKCMGCNSCMLACQAENNVPIVGKEEVMNNREMHWIRIDRFFKGSPDNPEMAFQPVHCQQCEGAPCEVVCPVEATVHSDEGLNDMAYNRCVGTRYCANNCPYKVRRFNYRYWNKDFDTARFKVRKLLSNPDVTVRSRGVMEKCTWCVQRIERTKIDAKNNRRTIVDGEIKTACEQACPTGAIRFGDLADKESVVYKNQELPRAYALLASLNNSPRNAFLARITNPNPNLATVKAKDHE
jgi:molybdopterin-containing oxidoreductase family iron-sulfur binding subunit